MAQRPLILLHGWNDTGEAFERLAGHLRRHLDERGIRHIALGDYLSRHDALRFDDLQAALERAWTRHDLPRTPASVDAIVHSTGGLVIRDWLARHFAPDAYPIKHLVMLAPANFGSPLAHRGRSLVGRAVNGFFHAHPDQPRFEAGAELLRGLELASPYSWALALRDRFADEPGPFAPGRTLCSVLVGNRGYGGIRAVANEAGGDGTVRISTANLDCARGRIHFEEGHHEGRPVTVPRLAGWQDSSGRCAFRIVDGLDHTTIKLDTPESRLSAAQRRALGLILEALAVEDDGFAAHCDAWEAATLALTRVPGGRRGKPGYQNTLVRVVDQFGAPVPDYLIEFYDPRDDRRDGGALARVMHEEIILKVHPYANDSSYRSFYIDTARLRHEVAKAGTALGLSITAAPMLGREAADPPVGFRTYADEDIDDLRLDAAQLAAFFRPHRTLLVDIVLHRSQHERVVTLRDDADQA
ncbi:esterase/lipase family protein [Bisbaumannia pacifica]|uniref:Alpha/beta hydrolase n=1 Tax=Bisbaumannia pacifica TaxID=77098 RepID=A0A510X4Q3_9GAMM|nr:alpha/beta hydrolase [Halomonas pacifica]MBH8580015.1 hypothetical protein [Halomonas pacifica]GEK46394.1 hypothetical protein HPA02_06770 [Halomonas pacifica]